MEQKISPSFSGKVLGALTLISASVAAPLAAQTSAQNTVKQRAKAFYGWYVGQVKQDKSPLARRAMMRRYVSRRLESWLYSPAFKEYGADYFLDAQDYDLDWDKLRTRSLKLQGNTATMQVILGRPKPASKGMGERALSLKWVREKGVWKIDRVNNR